eukprot:167831-Amphidinium_carterae.1
MLWDVLHNTIRSSIHEPAISTFFASVEGYVSCSCFPSARHYAEYLDKDFTGLCSAELPVATECTEFGKSCHKEFEDIAAIHPRK